MPRSPALDLRRVLRRQAGVGWGKTLLGFCLILLVLAVVAHAGGWAHDLAHADGHGDDHPGDGPWPAVDGGHGCELCIVGVGAPLQLFAPVGDALQTALHVNARVASCELRVLRPSSRPQSARPPPRSA